MRDILDRLIDWSVTTYFQLIKSSYSFQRADTAKSAVFVLFPFFFSQIIFKNTGKLGNFFLGKNSEFFVWKNSEFVSMKKLGIFLMKKTRNLFPWKNSEFFFWKFLEKNSNFFFWIISRYITEYQRNHGSLLATSLLELQTAYRNQSSDSTPDVYKRAVMGILSRAEPDQDFGGIIHSVHDWLWLKLAQTDCSSSSSSPGLTLPVLQQLVRFPFSSSTNRRRQGLHGLRSDRPIWTGRGAALSQPQIPRPCRVFGHWTEAGQITFALLSTVHRVGRHGEFRSVFPWLCRGGADLRGFLSAKAHSTGNTRHDMSFSHTKRNLSGSSNNDVSQGERERGRGREKADGLISVGGA